MYQTVDTRSRTRFEGRYRNFYGTSPEGYGWQPFWTDEAFPGSTVDYDPYYLSEPYRRIIGRLESATTSMYVDDLKHSQGRRTALCLTKVWNGHDWLYSGTQLEFDDALPCIQGGNIAVPDDTRANSRAKMAFVKQANNAQRQFEAGVFTGEFSQVSKMMRGTFNNAVSLLTKHNKTVKQRVLESKVRRRTPLKKRIEDANRIVADAWLQTQYGLLPLMSDIDGGAKALAQLTTYRRPTSTVTGKGADSYRQSHSVNTFDVGYMRFAYSVEEIVEAFVRYKGCVSIQDRGLGAVGQAFGLDQYNFLPTIYELAPYSFLIDYFSNLNEIVNAISFNYSSVMWCEKGRSESVARKSRVVISPKVPPGYQLAHFAGGSEIHGSLTKTFKVREPYTSHFVPNLMFEIPGVRQGFNIAALAASAGGITKLLTRHIGG